ncbi:Phosphatidylinositol-4-phosphate 5-Kinase [Phytophthora infestans]|uniref:Phosphatidylinositol-4-phosphate 5-Kinase n=1 Tax=Phytophthora infestans TaxID=4787 RepID=A0A833SRA3_PHYIN|nr:Phosphatidylinositol-4-phosphate 5-Kinase [Phytophthora infestans]
MEEGDSAGLYHEKKRLATTVYNGEYRYYEKLGFTDYAPKVFQNIREICGIDNEIDRRYLVKTMTKKEHSFLLEVLPLFHQYILKQPNSLLCRFLGCHSMQLPVGWNKMFFVVMENIFPDGPVDERYDLKGIFHQSNFRYQEGIPTPVSSDWSRSGREEERMVLEEVEGMLSESQSVDSELGQVTEKQPLLRRGSSRPSLRYDNDFVIRRASLCVNPTTRANLLAQVTSDCGFLQELGIMDYSCLLGIRHYNRRIEPDIMDNLAHNAIVSADQSTVYYLGFVDILQHYNIDGKSSTACWRL